LHHPKVIWLKNDKMTHDDKIWQYIFHEWKGAIGGGQDAILKNISNNKTHGGKKNKKKPSKIEGCLMYIYFFPQWIELLCRHMTSRRQWHLQRRRKGESQGKMTKKKYNDEK
jgi:hypothetical protein